PWLGSGLALFRLSEPLGHHTLFWGVRGQGSFTVSWPRECFVQIGRSDPRRALAVPLSAGGTSAERRFERPPVPTPESRPHDREESCRPSANEEGSGNESRCRCRLP